MKNDIGSLLVSQDQTNNHDDRSVRRPLQTLSLGRPRISTKLRSLLICLVVGLLSTAARAQAPLELTSITSTTNGVRVAWTDPVPGNAYTIQVRESLTSGDWRDGAMRYRWPWPFAHWGDAPRNLPAARFYRVLAQPAVTPNRGKLLTNSLRKHYDTNALNAYAAAVGVSGFVHPQFGIANRPFTYETVDPYGLPITASALLILPSGTNGPLPLLSLQHGTLVQNIYAPSQSEAPDDSVRNRARRSGCQRPQT